MPHLKLLLRSLCVYACARALMHVHRICQCTHAECWERAPCVTTCFLLLCRENRQLEEFPLRLCVCVCVYASVFPHSKACSLIFNAAETTSTPSEPGEASFLAQTNLPCQQETKLRDTVWNGSKHGCQEHNPLSKGNPPNSIQETLAQQSVAALKVLHWLKYSMFRLSIQFPHSKITRS